MTDETPVHVAVVLGTVRQGRRSERVAKWLVPKLNMMAGVTANLIDLRDIELSTDDAGRADPDPGFSAAVGEADGLVLVVPEYNGSYPGLLKHALDTLRDEYVHKAVGVAPVTVGGLGGARLVPTLLPTLRDFGLVVVRRDFNVSHVEDAFTEDGAIRDERLEGRAERFLDELVWMARVLRAGREKGNNNGD